MVAIRQGWARCIALLCSLQIISLATAQANETVYASVVFARTGERTPVWKLAGQTIKLTPYGAQQMANLGTFFRQRYLSGPYDSSTQGSARRPISLLSQDIYEMIPLQLEAIDQQYAQASATAFMQSFYPPHIVSSADGTQIDTDYNTVNGSWLNYPLQGYQYPLIDQRSINDPSSIYLDAYSNCLVAGVAESQYYSTLDANTTKANTLNLYQSVGSQFMPQRSSSEMWSYRLAYSFYETLNYLNRHNGTVANDLRANGTNRGLIDTFGALAARKQWRIFGNLTQSGLVKGDQISVIGGKTLATKIVSLLNDQVVTAGTYQKFSLMVGEYPSMIALFALMGLDKTQPGDFYMIPPFGSAFAFELYTNVSNAEAPVIPQPLDLYVRFLYTNASDPTSGASPVLSSYPMFNYGSEGMPYASWVAAMNTISLGDLSEYCNLCQANTLFCAPFINSATNGGAGPRGPGSRSKGGLSNAVAGVIGAFVTLAVILLIGLGMIFLCGIGFHRRQKSKSVVGGYKGSDKLASDADLSFPKNASPMGVDSEAAAGAGGAVVSAKRRGHERVGSWELKGEPKAGLDDNNTPAGHQRFGSLASTAVGPESGLEQSPFDHDDDDLHDLDVVHSTPTAPRENI